jgi:hypothetical protein
MTAMMLGAAYAGGVLFFGRSLQVRQWRRIKVGFPAVATFASVLGIATILHWDKFIHDSIAFWAWAILYFTTPFLVVGTWVRQRRLDRDPHAPEEAVPAAVRWLLGVVGVGMIAISVVLFVAPSAVSGVWPWTLTPLTTRVMAAMFALPGMVGLGIFLDPRWSAARIVIEAQILSIGMILVGALRDAADINFGMPAAWLFVGGLGAFEVLLAGLWVRFQLGARANRAGGTAS